MGYMDFLEQRIIIIPPGMWSFLPHWLSLDFIGKNRRVPKLLQTRLPAGRCSESTPLRTITAKRRHQTPGTSCRKQSLGNRAQKTC